jgi:hypothetical protein
MDIEVECACPMLNDLSGPQRELAVYMSALSEEAYHAGWMEGLEFDLWRAVVHGPFEYCRLQLTQDHVQRLIQLSEACGGWILFHASTEETFVALSDWLRLLEKA